jgi:hypothetical protein
MQAGLFRGALPAAVALALVGAVTGCGGGKSTQAPGTTTQSDQPTGSSTVDASTAQLAVQIKSRLTAAGYAVHDVKQPRPTIRGPVDVQALAHGPQQTFIAVSGDTDKTYAQLHDELAAVTRQARARAIANRPMTKQMQQKLVTLSANLRDLSRHELGVYVFNSTADAASYAVQLEAQNTHVLSLPGAGDLSKYKAVGPVVYFADVLEESGHVKFDQGAFDKFVALAAGRDWSSSGPPIR